jgi:LDH2 family malate/lactate/ureidoglycolate dehydrogenase
VPPVELPEVGVRASPAAVRAWCQAIVESLGTPVDIAADVADVLVAADLRGVASHGTFRLPVYCRLAEAGVLAVEARPARIGGTSVISLWDGRDGWGAHAGRVLIDDAIARASSLGMAAALVRHASHFGIAGWYAMRAAAAGMIGVVMTNTSPLVAPTRGRGQVLGTNPIAVAAPSAEHGMFVLDMATSAITWGRVLVAQRRGQALPAHVAMDTGGDPSADPAAVLDGGALLPLGGLEESAGYKGYGLALMVDILTGVLAGANTGTRVVPFSTALGPSDLGQLFIAINPVAVDADDFDRRVDLLLEDVLSAPAAPGGNPGVVIPGQPEADRERLQRRIGIVLDELDHASLAELGGRLSVPFPETRPFRCDALEDWE